MAEDKETTTEESGEEAAEVEEQPKAEEEVKTEEEPKAEEQPKAEEEAKAEEEPKVEEKPKAEKVAEATKAASADTAKTKAAAKKPAKATKAVAIDDIMDTIKNMTVLELADLVKALENEFGVTAAAPIMAAATGAAPVAATAAVEEEEEKTEFNVILKEIGANKISVIRAVRELTSLGLKESKDLVESAPKPVKEGVNKDDAAAAKQKLEEAGATAEIT